MQELALIQPGRSAEKEFAQEAAAVGLRREFEERLPNAGRWPIASRAACCATARMLKMWRKRRCCVRTGGRTLADRARFRAWLVRIAFRLASIDTLFEAARSARNALVAIGASGFDRDIAATAISAISTGHGGASEAPARSCC